jgi:hypothetical protein
LKESHRNDFPLEILREVKGSDQRHDWR